MIEWLHRRAASPAARARAPPGAALPREDGDVGHESAHRNSRNAGRSQQMTRMDENVLNPLRDPRDKRLPRVAGPCVLVLFGVTGDLARKKLLPAIYDLANRGLLPPGFAVVGVSTPNRGSEGVR